jgi:hypothetical protein
VHGAEIDIQYGRSSSFDQVIRSSDIPLEDTKRAAVYRPRRLLSTTRTLETTSDFNNPRMGLRMSLAFLASSRSSRSSSNIDSFMIVMLTTMFSRRGCAETVV